MNPCQSPAPAGNPGFSRAKIDAALSAIKTDMDAAFHVEALDDHDHRADLVRSFDAHMDYLEGLIQIAIDEAMRSREGIALSFHRAKASPALNAWEAFRFGDGRPEPCPVYPAISAVTNAWYAAPDNAHLDKAMCKAISALRDTTEAWTARLVTLANAMAEELRRCRQ